MKIKNKIVRRFLFGITFVLTIVLGPYFFSRLLSSSQQVSLHRLDAINSEFIRGKREKGKEVIKVACYNIAHGRGLAKSNWRGGSLEEREGRLNQIAELLKSIDADIVVLNEIDFNCSWSYSVNQAKFLAEKAGYSYWAEQRNFDFRVFFWKWQFGNAILSKYPIEEVELINLPEFSSLETVLVGKKKGLNCVINVNGNQLNVVGVHLSHRSEAVRARSAKMISKIAKECHFPVVLAGDLNSSPTGFPKSHCDGIEGNAIDILDKTNLFQRFPISPPLKESELTYHAARPSVVIDWILVHKSLEIKKHNAIASTLSDHRPIEVVFSLEERKVHYKKTP